MTATLQQYLHQFDAAALNLEMLVLRTPSHAQAWLTLATVRRVQGRYGLSDRACDAVFLAGAVAYAQACKAENASLRGDFNGARRAMLSILTQSSLPAETRNWILTTLAESEERAGLSSAAERAFRAAQEAQADSYTAMSFADFLLQQRRFADAKGALGGQPRTDTVLLRLAIAGVLGRLPGADADVRELRDRMNLANLRPDTRSAHAREQAMFALWIDADARHALELARENVRHQREPIDVLIVSRAASAAHDETAMRELIALSREMGLVDVRLDAQR
jgi:hypothetical protein